MDRNRAALSERMDVERFGREERWRELTSRVPGAADRDWEEVPADPRALMDWAEHWGRFDRTAAGLLRLRRGRVGEEWSTCTVCAHAGMLVVTFMSEERRGHSRRLLVSGRDCYLEMEGKAFLHKGKYAAAAMTLLARRAFEADGDRIARAA